jgi:hypothetical protein
LKNYRNIKSELIEGWCKKKLVFALPLLPFGTVWEAYAHCTHLQITQADTQPKFAKECNFCQPTKIALFLLVVKLNGNEELLYYTN